MALCNRRPSARGRAPQQERLRPTNPRCPASFRFLCRRRSNPFRRGGKTSTRRLVVHPRLMLSIDKIGTLLKVGGLLYALFVGIAAYLVSKGVDDVSHFGLYLIGQTWVELAVVLICYLIYRQHSENVAKIWSVVRSHPAALGARNYFGLGMLLLSFVVFATAGYALLRARIEFWGGECRAAYANRNSERIVELIAAGRIGDAYKLAKTTHDALSGSSESGYVDHRLNKLTGAIQRSEKLTKQIAGGAWNPITERSAYFGIAEAVRVNPQNYAAADKLRAMLGPLTATYLPADT